MKSILQVTLCLLTISSTLSAATYLTTSGSIQDILKTSGKTHPYSGESLSPHAYLALADLRRADLTSADLRSAVLYGSDLALADLTGANLNGANLNGANLYNANLAGASLYNADFSNVTLYGADLIGADLIGADFYFAWLNFANFSYADLTNADLTNAWNVHTATWLNSNLYGATLPIGYNQAWFEEEGAIFEETVPEPSNYALLLGGLALGLMALRRR